MLGGVEVLDLPTVVPENDARDSTALILATSVEFDDFRAETRRKTLINSKSIFINPRFTMHRYY